MFKTIVTLCVLSHMGHGMSVHNVFQQRKSKKDHLKASLLSDNLIALAVEEPRSEFEQKYGYIPEYFTSVFKQNAYPFSAYYQYEGNDYTSLFASSVSANDGYIVIGSHGYDLYGGQIRVYHPINDNDAWEPTATINSPFVDANFGVSVAVSKDRILVGANSIDSYTGQVFVYSRVDGTEEWELSATLDSPLGPAQGYGYRVDLHGDTAIVGTAVNDAFIYEWDGSSWNLNSSLTCPDGQANAQGLGPYFGRAVALSGDFAVVGAHQAADNSGRVYVYRRGSGGGGSGTGTSAGGWELVSKLAGGDDSSAHFGYSVSIDGDVIVAGARGYATNTYDPTLNLDLIDMSNNNGSASVFNRAGQYWNLTTVIASPVGTDSFFGTSVAVRGENIIVGATGFPFGNSTGAAFTYTLADSSAAGTGEWALNFSHSSPAGRNGHFGNAVTISDEWGVIIGANGYSEFQGSVYFAPMMPTFTNAPTEAPTFAPSAFPSAEPFIAPTSQPSSQPSSQPTTPDPIVLALGGTGGGAAPFDPFFMILMALGAIVLLALAASMFYLCCCGGSSSGAAAAAAGALGLAALIKKDKKDEEGPYVVAGYDDKKKDEVNENDYDIRIIKDPARERSNGGGGDVDKFVAKNEALAAFGSVDSIEFDRPGAYANTPKQLHAKRVPNKCNTSQSTMSSSGKRSRSRSRSDRSFARTLSDNIRSVMSNSQSNIASSFFTNSGTSATGSKSVMNYGRNLFHNQTAQRDGTLNPNCPPSHMLVDIYGFGGANDTDEFALDAEDFATDSIRQLSVLPSDDDMSLCSTTVGSETRKATVHSVSTISKSHSNDEKPASMRSRSGEIRLANEVQTVLKVACSPARAQRRYSKDGLPMLSASPDSLPACSSSDRGDALAVNRSVGDHSSSHHSLAHSETTPEIVQAASGPDARAKFDMYRAKVLEIHAAAEAEAAAATAAAAAPATEANKSKAPPSYAYAAHNSNTNGRLNLQGSSTTARASSMLAGTRVSAGSVFSGSSLESGSQSVPSSSGLPLSHNGGSSRMAANARTTGVGARWDDSANFISESEQSLSGSDTNTDARNILGAPRSGAELARARAHMTQPFMRPSFKSTTAEPKSPSYAVASRMPSARGGASAATAPPVLSGSFDAQSDLSSPATRMSGDSFGSMGSSSNGLDSSGRPPRGNGDRRLMASNSSVSSSSMGGSNNKSGSGTGTSSDLMSPGVMARLRAQQNSARARLSMLGQSAAERASTKKPERMVMADSFKSIGTEDDEDGEQDDIDNESNSQIREERKDRWSRSATLSRQQAPNSVLSESFLGGHIVAGSDHSSSDEDGVHGRKWVRQGTLSKRKPYSAPNTVENSFWDAPPMRPNTDEATSALPGSSKRPAFVHVPQSFMNNESFVSSDMGSSREMSADESA